MKKLSVVLAVRNEEKNIGKCLESVKNIAGEIIVVDEHSTDKTVEIAKKYGAKVYEEPHHPIFHVTKQKALDHVTGDWILQLDADERVTPELAKEIESAISGKPVAISESKLKLFERHQRVIEKRDGKTGADAGEVVAYYLPRRNLFLGRPLIHAGVYPDGVIRLIKKGKAYFPAKSVHEQIVINGRVSWLGSDLIHDDSPTFERYLARLNRYTDLKARELWEVRTPKNVFVLFYYSFIKSLVVFLTLYIRHKGFLDGMRGFVWSLFSALHYPVAYFKYWQGN